jgi:hypothetical protein
MRAVGDPTADAVIAQLFSNNQVASVNALMSALVENDDLVPAGLPEPVQAFLKETEVLPPWADAQRMRRGEQVFWQYGAVIISCLFCYGLPVCYAARKGVQVLALTSRLYSNPTRRIIETAQMMVDVMRPGGMARFGKGIRSAQKVRLMHAAVRYLISRHAQWNPEWDTPINQEDLVGTLMAFSWVVIDGLRRLGFAVSDQEAEDYLYAWRMAGHFIGVREDIMPADVASAAVLMKTIEERQFGPSPEGRMMTKALIDLMQYIIPGTIFDRVPVALMRYLMGSQTSDLLAIDHHALDDALIVPMKLVGIKTDHLIERSPALRQITTVFSRKLIESILLVGRGGKRVTFDIPADLRQTWGVNWLG